MLCLRAFTGLEVMDAGFEFGADTGAQRISVKRLKEGLPRLRTSLL